MIGWGRWKESVPHGSVLVWYDDHELFKGWYMAVQGEDTSAPLPINWFFAVTT